VRREPPNSQRLSIVTPEAPVPQDFRWAVEDSEGIGRRFARAISRLRMGFTPHTAQTNNSRTSALTDSSTPRCERILRCKGGSRYTSAESGGEDI